MIRASEVLNDNSTFAFLKVPSVVPEELTLLSLHPDPAVRIAAVSLVKSSKILAFAGDENEAVRLKLSESLKAL